MQTSCYESASLSCGVWHAATHAHEKETYNMWIPGETECNKSTYCLAASDSNIGFPDNARDLIKIT